MKAFGQVGMMLLAAALAAGAADTPAAPPAPVASPAATTAFIATLRNGFTIQFERREVRDGVARLYISGEDYIDVPAAQIAEIEQAEVVAVPAPPPAPTIGQLVNEAGNRHQLDPDFLHSVVRAESGYNPRAVSRKGAQGLMQLMPATAAELGVSDSFQPAANLEGGARYLRELLRRYGNDPIKALAAYNAGPHRVQQYGGVPPYRETRAYVARIVRDFNRAKRSQKKSAGARPGRALPTP